MKAEAKVVPFTQLCAEYGISPKTGYKWLQRFREGGIAALADQSTKPKSSPSGLPEDIVCRIIRLKQAHPHWGPRKIMALYERKYSGDLPSESSFKRVLEKAGLVDKRVRRPPAADAGRIQLRREAQESNEVWTADFKGWWPVGDNRRCEPLTVRDAHSRFLLCAEPLESTRTGPVRERFEKLFETYGLPTIIRTDNGPPFASARGLHGLSALSVWWLAVGISLDRIDPGRPDQNGSHERMHRDISLEVEALSCGDIDSQRTALSLWRDEYNQVRPHEALGYRTPAELYKPSSRRFEGTPKSLVYPDNYAERKVRKEGVISLGKALIFISTALRGWNVGLREEKEGCISVWFGALHLGHIDRQTDSFSAGAPAVEMPP